jgi:hypothetical protein
MSAKNAQKRECVKEKLMILQSGITQTGSSRHNSPVKSHFLINIFR